MQVGGIVLDREGKQVSDIHFGASPNQSFSELGHMKYRAGPMKNRHGNRTKNGFGTATSRRHRPQLLRSLSLSFHGVAHTHRMLKIKQRRRQRTLTEVTVLEHTEIVEKTAPWKRRLIEHTASSPQRRQPLAVAENKASPSCPRRSFANRMGRADWRRLRYPRECLLATAATEPSMENPTISLHPHGTGHNGFDGAKNT